MPCGRRRFILHRPSRTLLRVRCSIRWASATAGHGICQPRGTRIIQHLNASGIPAYAAPESCAAALKALQQRPDAHAFEDRAKPVVDISDLPTGALNEAHAKRLCAQFGLPITREVIATTPSEAASKAADFGDLLSSRFSRRKSCTSRKSVVSLSVLLRATSRRRVSGC